MERNIALAFLTVVVSIPLIACTRSDPGPVGTDLRTVEPFQSIELRGAASLTITAGVPQSVEVEGTQRGRDRLDTTVQSGRLIVETHRSWWETNGSDIRLRIGATRLDALAVQGAGDVRVTGLDGGSFSLASNGAGNFKIAGRVDRLEAALNGASDADLAGLTAGDADVVVNGASDVQLTATGALGAIVNGVGSIRYGGPPSKVQSKVNGVGTIAPR